ncbi:hypothetical protein [Roseivirga seohaensis]|uniref:hypothetical protein n=1 Tax=Roseivirga seohaensis TaxID=1914963 RepID=UPI003BAD2222
MSFYNKFKDLLININSTDALMRIGIDRIKNDPKNFDHSFVFHDRVLKEYPGDSWIDFAYMESRAVHDIGAHYTKSYQFLLKNSLVLFVTYAEEYTSELVHYLHKTTPEVFNKVNMRNFNIDLKWELLQDANSIHILKKEIVDRISYQLSFKPLKESMKEILRWLKVFELFSEEMIKLNDISKIRNQIIHKNSKIDQQFLNILSSQVRSSFLNLEEIILTKELWNSLVYNCFHVYENCDNKICERMEELN